MLGAYFAPSQPSVHRYIDTSQPLSGVGGLGNDVIDIYEGVAGPPAPLGARRPGCGCSAGKRGRLGGLRGFGNEVLPGEGLEPSIPASTVSSTGLPGPLLAFIAVGTLIAVGVVLTDKKKPMRANRRRRRARRS